MSDVKNDTSLGDASLVSYWELEEASGTRVDSHSTNNLTDINTVTQDTSGIQGNAAKFTAVNSEYLEITNASQTGLDVTTDFSISLWVKLTTLPSVDNELVNKAFGTGDSGYRLFMTNDNKLRLYYWNATADTTDISASAFFVSADVGNWVHILVTVNLTGSIIMYRNGASVSITADTARATTILAATNPFRLGSHHGPGAYLNGALDEVGLWTKILTPSDVATLYNGGIGIPYDASGGGTPTVRRGALMLGA